MSIVGRAIRKAMILSGPVWLLILSTPSLVVAQGDEAFVAYRQKVMGSLGANMGGIGDIMKYKLPKADGHIEIHARNIHETAKLILDAFEEQVTAGKTDAKPDIWQNWEEFTTKAKALQDASATLTQVAQGGDMKAILPAVKTVGDACKGCHDPFRKPEEESYKNQ